MKIQHVLRMTLMLAAMLAIHGVCVSRVTASGLDNDYFEAVKLYNKGDYESSLSLFESIAGRPVVNGELYYNIGNAYFKKGDLGRSILWYERALKLIPGDPDLQFNHHYVSGLVVDKNEMKTNPLTDVLLFWRNGLTLRTSVMISVALMVGFCILSISRWVWPQPWLKYTERFVLCLALLFTGSAFYDYYTIHFVKEAIVLSEKVPVRSGLEDSATELFSLHAGTKIRVEDELRNYAKIRFADDKIGWLDKKNIEMIQIF